MSASKNLEYEKNSFLNKSNSAFIEQMYLKFVNKDSDLPNSWRDYFEGIGDELNIIAKELNTEFAKLIADQMIHDSIRTDMDKQLPSIPNRIGARNPKLLTAIKSMENNIEDPLSPLLLPLPSSLSPSPLSPSLSLPRPLSSPPSPPLHAATTATSAATVMRRLRLMRQS